MKKIDNALFINGLICFFIGLLLWYFGNSATEVLLMHLGTFICFVGVFKLLRCLSKNFRTKKEILLAISYIIFSVILNHNVNIASLIIIVFITIYQLFLGIVCLYNFYLQKKDGVKVTKIFFIRGLIHIFLSLSTFINIEDYKTLAVYNRIGLYLILLGIMYIIDSLSRFEKYNIKNNKRKIRIRLPVIFSALFTTYSLRKDNEKGENYSKEFLEKKAKGAEGKNADLEVWVHTAERGASIPGHVDISYRGKTYSYGHYDEDSHELFGSKGDGVLYIVDTEKYGEWIQNKHNYKGVYRYGISLTPKQRITVEYKISEIMSNTYEYEFTTPTQKKSYLGILSADIPTKIYKFHRTRFKTYFVLTTNCVLLADTIVGDTGFDIVSVAGISSPGSYKLYLDKEYEKIYSNVITKTLYKNTTK